MPIVIRAKKSDSTNDVIKKFKKIVSIANIMEIAKDREFHMKPSLKKNIRYNELKRQKRRAIRLAKKARGLK